MATTPSSTDSSGRTAQRHVLADRGDRILDAFSNGLAGCRVVRSGNGLDRTVGANGDVGDAANEVLEGIVAGNEVGFGVDFDDDGLGAVARNADQAFSSGAARLLVGLGDALGAQPVDRGFHVAIGFGEGLLAVHHACAGLFAQFLHHCCSNMLIFLPLVCSAGASRKPARYQEDVAGNDPECDTVMKARHRDDRIVKPVSAIRPMKRTRPFNFFSRKRPCPDFI